MFSSALNFSNYFYWDSLVKFSSQIVLAFSVLIDFSHTLITFLPKYSFNSKFYSKTNLLYVDFCVAFEWQTLFYFFTVPLSKDYLKFILICRQHVIFFMQLFFEIIQHFFAIIFMQIKLDQSFFDIVFFIHNLFYILSIIRFIFILSNL